MIEAEQAEAVVRAIGTAQEQLVTKPDLQEARAPIHTNLTLLKWMMGALLFFTIFRTFMTRDGEPV